MYWYCNFEKNSRTFFLRKYPYWYETHHLFFTHPKNSNTLCSTHHNLSHSNTCRVCTSVHPLSLEIGNYCIRVYLSFHSITQLMSCVRGPTIDSRIETLDVGIPLLQIKYEVKVDEHCSSSESCYVIHLDIWHLSTGLLPILLKWPRVYYFIAFEVASGVKFTFV